MNSPTNYRIKYHNAPVLFAVHKSGKLLLPPDCRGSASSKLEGRPSGNQAAVGSFGPPLDRHGDGVSPRAG